jgi:hypothetical protein
MKQTSHRNPPQTGYHRPTERKFYVWQDQFNSYGGYSAYADGRWGLHPWRWMCTMCDPPAYGFRARRGAYHAIMTQVMPDHLARHRKEARR